MQRILVQEKYNKLLESEGDAEISMALLRQMFEKYLIILHPFMPFITEIDNDKEPDKLGSIIVGVISGVIMVGIIVWLIFFNKLG